MPDHPDADHYCFTERGYIQLLTLGGQFAGATGLPLANTHTHAMTLARWMQATLDAPKIRPLRIGTAPGQTLESFLADLADWGHDLTMVFAGMEDGEPAWRVYTPGACPEPPTDHAGEDPDASD